MVQLVATGVGFEKRARKAEVDRATLVGCKAGEPRAFRAFVLGYEKAVFSLLSRMLGRGPHVQDLAQETFLRAYRAFPAFEIDAETRPSTWLLTIALRLALNAKRRVACAPGAFRERTRKMTDDVDIEWEAWASDDPPSDFADQVMDAMTGVRPVRRSPWGSRERASFKRVAVLVAAATAVVSFGLLAAVRHRIWQPTARQSARSAKPMAIDGRASANEPDHSVSPASEPRVPVLSPGTILDRRRRDEIRAQIKPALESQGIVYDPKTGLTLPAGSNGPSHNLTHEYIQARVREDFYPLARSCYEAALQKSPKLRGRFVIDFMIVGDAEVGGIVDQAKINEKSDIDDPEFATCMRESMLSMVFAPPENDGWVTVTYPILFSPGDEESRDR